MICPNCKAEYREGFTRCADCDVELVPDPSPEDLAAFHAPTPGDPSEDPFCSFWKGEDPRVHAELCGVLDEAGIPHNTVYRRDHLFNLSNFPSFEVGVPFSLFPKAELAVKEAFGTEDSEDRETLNTPRLITEGRPDSPRKLSSPMTPSDEGNVPGPPSAGESEDWPSEDATVKVWAAEGAESGDFIVAALHENGIPCRLDLADSGAMVFVLPADEARAREIVREIVEQTPPPD